MAETALRATVHGRVQGVGFRAATVRRARDLGVQGWVRNDSDGTVGVHAEGPADQVAQLEAFLREGRGGAHVERVDVTAVKVEGHEQFAVRGVPAGRFVVREHGGATPGFTLSLEVGGAMRSWAVPKGPSMNPADKRFAAEVDEPAASAGAVVWDSGPYEQGGRVPWPEAIERGHAVFVLHGERLRGGFALQRTRTGERPQWLLVKRRDEHAATALTS